MFASLSVTVKQHIASHQSSPGVVAGAAWKAPTAQVRDEAGKNQADRAAEQDSGVGPLHHPVKHKCLNTETDVINCVILSHCKLV